LLDSITNSLVPKDWFSGEDRPEEYQLTVGAAGAPHSWRQQVIYLIMPDRFFNGDTTNDQLGMPECYDPSDPSKFHGGDLTGVRRRLDYLRELGVSTVWLTPVYQQVQGIAGSGGSKQGACGYHGYWPDFGDPPTGSLEPKLGTETDLTGLISELHGRGMRFIIDMVVNHAGYGARIWDQHRDWFHPPDTCAALGDPIIFCPLAGLPDFKQENDYVSKYLIDESTSWVHRFRVDGIRMDTARHVPGPFFRDRWIPAINSVRNNLFLLAEAFLEQSALQLKPFVVDQGFDSAFNFPLRRALVDALAKGGSVDFIAESMQETVAMLGLERTLLLVNFLDNHDVPRFVSEPGPPVAEKDIQKRYRLALIALFTLPGIPQLYYGSELGLYGGADPDNRRDMPDWAWEPSGRSQSWPGQALLIPQLTFSDVQKLIRIRNENAALYRGDYAEMWRQNGDPQPNVYAFFRSDGGSRIITALNNGDVPLENLSMPIMGNGDIAVQDRVALVDGTVLEDIWDAGAPSPLTVSDGHLTLNLPAKIAGIYRPRSSENASAVTFRVRAHTALGETLYISGNSAELGFWDPRQAVRLKSSDCIGSECTWSMTLRYLPQGKSLVFKFLRKAEAVSMWEAGSERAFTVPATSAATYDGKLLND